jgi:hypothetical protein
VTEAQYHSLLGDLLWRRADTVVWLDLPRHTVMRQVIRRSAVRSLTREELWNGNRERLRTWLEPDHPTRQAWNDHARKRADAEARIAAHPHVTAIRLTSARDVRRWPKAAGSGGRGAGPFGAELDHELDHEPASAAQRVPENGNEAADGGVGTRSKARPKYLR